ncbi:MAG: DUF3313 domain-containing protein [Thiohalocapsa sp.]
MRSSLRAMTAVAVLTTVLCSGAATGADLGDYQPKGFLSSYAGLHPRGDGSGAFLYEDTAVDRSKYNRLMIDRIQIFLKNDAAYQGVDPAELKALVDYFRAAIEQAVAGRYPIVSEPSPDVLRLRIAVVDLVPNRPEASVAALAIPFAGVADAAAGLVKERPGSGLFVGEATVEMEALDSMSGDQVAAFVETRVGKKYDIDLDDGIDGAVKKGVGGYAKAYSSWAYTKQAMDAWAELVRERLDAAHGAAKSP